MTHILKRKLSAQRVRRKFTIIVKLDAIKTWRSQGKNLRQTVKRLGLFRSQLRGWIKQENVLKRASFKQFRQCAPRGQI